MSNWGETPNRLPEPVVLPRPTPFVPLEIQGQILYPELTERTFTTIYQTNPTLFRDYAEFREWLEPSQLGVTARTIMNIYPETLLTAELFLLFLPYILESAKDHSLFIFLAYQPKMVYDTFATQNLGPRAWGALFEGSTLLITSTFFGGNVWDLEEIPPAVLTTFRATGDPTKLIKHYPDIFNSHPLPRSVWRANLFRFYVDRALTSEDGNRSFIDIPFLFNALTKPAEGDREVLVTQFQKLFAERLDEWRPFLEYRNKEVHWTQWPVIDEALGFYIAFPRRRVTREYIEDCLAIRHAGRDALRTSGHRDIMSHSLYDRQLEKFYEIEEERYQEQHPNEA